MYTYFDNVSDKFNDEFADKIGKHSPESELLIACVYKHCHKGDCNINSDIDMQVFRSICEGIEEWTSTLNSMEKRRELTKSKTSYFPHFQ